MARYVLTRPDADARGEFGNRDLSEVLKLDIKKATIRTDDHIRIIKDDKQFDIFGERFDYTPTGNVSGGVIRSITRKTDGKVDYELKQGGVFAKALNELKKDPGFFIDVFFSQNDEIIGSNTHGDRLEGLRNDDKLDGRGGNDTILGGEGEDKLFGRAGDDVLIGGLGRDELTGGLGSDRFVFTSTEDSRVYFRDTVYFSSGDKVDLHLIDANTKISGNQKFKWVDKQHLDADFTGKAGQLRFDRGILEGDTDGNGSANFQIKIVGAFSAADVIL